MRLGYTLLSYKSAMNINRKVTIESKLLKWNERIVDDLKHLLILHYATLKPAVFFHDVKQKIEIWH